jgi:membrane protease YdiL (CAAX protease family)
MESLLRDLIFYAFAGMLVFLRFDARRFSAAEHDDEDAPGGWRLWLRRLSWYGLGLLLIVVVYNMHPLPLSVLHLQLGDDRTQAILAGLALAAVGTLIVVAYAWLRFGRLRYPPPRRYPAGVLNSVGTAILDEAAFRGVLLGLLIAADWPAEYAIAFQAVLYGLATRLSRPGMPLTMLLLALAMGVVGGWLTLETGGIGAALLGHALARLALFSVTGHAGVRLAPDEEDLREELEDQLPEGLEVVLDEPPETEPRRLLP